MSSFSLSGPRATLMAAIYECLFYTIVIHYSKNRLAISSFKTILCTNKVKWWTSDWLNTWKLNWHFFIQKMRHYCFQENIVYKIFVLLFSSKVTVCLSFMSKMILGRNFIYQAESEKLNNSGGKKSYATSFILQKDFRLNNILLMEWCMFRGGSKKKCL